MMEKIKKIDDKGNLIYRRSYTGFEQWFEYDGDDNLIHYKDSYGYEYWREFDKNGNRIYYRDSYGREKWYKWDHKNQIEITEQEYLNIKKNKEHKEFIFREKINPFELLDLEE